MVVVPADLPMYPEPVEIRPGLFIGNAASSAYFWRQRKHIGAVVRLSPGPPLPPSLPVLRIIIDDDPNENIACYFHDTNHFIAGNLAEGRNVLIHCQQGVSRSATIMIAFLVSFLGMMVDDVMDIVRQRAPWISPNSGFMEQLYRSQNTLIRSAVLLYNN